MQRNLPVLVAVSALLAVLAGPVGAADSQTVRVTDYSGAPPFKRVLVTRSAESAEFARFEEQAPVVGAQLRKVDFRGVPPYLRSVQTVTETDAAEFARFEEEPDAASRPRRSGPPGKTFSHRRR